MRIFLLSLIFALWSSQAVGQTIPTLTSPDLLKQQVRLDISLSNPSLKKTLTVDNLRQINTAMATHCWGPSWSVYTPNYPFGTFDNPWCARTVDEALFMGSVEWLYQSIVNKQPLFPWRR